MKLPRSIPNCTLSLSARLLLAALLVFPVALPQIARSQEAQAKRKDASDAALTASLSPISDAIYETSFRDSNIEIFSPNGVFLGLVGKLGQPTGIVFDKAGNLFVASDDTSSRGNAIREFAADGSVSTFTTTGLSGPHGLAFDAAGNLYVANHMNSTVMRYTPDGVGTVFADRADNAIRPIGLAFASAGNLFVTTDSGGGGKLIKITPDGASTVFAASGFNLAYGVALDSHGYIYVSNKMGNTVKKFAPDGTDLGVFCSSGLSAPLGMVFDTAGFLYVANANTATLEKFAPDGTDLGPFCTTRGGPHFMAIFYPK